MSVASTESKKANHSYILKRYGYYKSSCKELTILNDELYQELHTVKNKLELKTLELNDASSLVEEKTKELENMTIEMEQLKKKLSIKEKENIKLSDDNAIFADEIITLKTQLNDLSLQNDAQELVNKEKTEYKPEFVEEKLMDKKCNSWWCPKHSDLATVYKKLDIKTLNDKIEIDQAIKRQRYWSRQGEVRCCVFLNVFKSGFDKHADPPNCLIEYNRINKNLDLIEKKINLLSVDVSSDEDI